MRLWAVVGGAHKADCVYSIWTTQSSAEAEQAGLALQKFGGGCNGGEFHVVSVAADGHFVLCQSCGLPTTVVDVRGYCPFCDEGDGD